MPRIFSWSSGSKDVGFIEAFCSKMAQHRGVAKVRMTPSKLICIGAAAQGIRLKSPLPSKLFITRGMRTIPGEAMPTLLATTMDMPCRAAILDSPILSPDSVKTVIPFCSSPILIKGRLILLATATDVKGTSLPTRGGRDLDKWLRLRAVVSAPPVAAT